MLPVERQRAIVARVRDRGSATIAELVDALGVSHMTVRRDIASLEQRGLVVGVSGGVAAPGFLVADAPHEVKLGRHPVRKQHLARACLDLLDEAEWVYIDAGTTGLAIAEQIRDRRVGVVTNDLAVAGVLAAARADGGAPVKLIGGDLDASNGSTDGPVAAAQIADCRIDLAFLSTPAFDLHGVWVPAMAKKMVKQAILDTATTTTLVTDSSKYGLVAEHLCMGLEALGMLVCDAALPTRAAHRVASMTTLITVEVTEENHEHH